MKGRGLLGLSLLMVVGLVAVFATGPIAAIVSPVI